MNIIDNIKKGNADYIPDSGLIMAMDAALILGQPLLITGEPGVGKTEFADFVASCLGLPLSLKFECKSTTESRDIFYHYDAIGRLQAKDLGKDVNPLNYIYYNGLGLAIIRSNIENKYLSINEKFINTRSVVLIDEIDKAPTDFPNDILNEIEKLYFKIREYNNVEVKADPSNHPIIIITSNSDKQLPKAFLRRCVYYSIPFPKRNQIEDILSKKISIYSDDKNISKSLDLFYKLRSLDIEKKPTTSELISWFIYINSKNQTTKEDLQSGLGILVKTKDDLIIANDVFEQLFYD